MPLDGKPLPRPKPLEPPETASDSAAVVPDDGDLVQRCQRGDTVAFNELVTRYRGKVYAMIYNMVRNEQDAWDLAQDGFLKAWKSIGRFRGQSSFYTWLYRIMMNVTIDALRRKQPGGEAEFDDTIGLRNIDPGSTTTPKTGVMPHEKVAGDEIRARIDAAVARLTPRASGRHPDARDRGDGVPGDRRRAGMLDRHGDVPAFLRPQKNAIHAEGCV